MISAESGDCCQLTNVADPDFSRQPLCMYIRSGRVYVIQMFPAIKRCPVYVVTRR